MGISIRNEFLFRTPYGNADYKLTKSQPVFRVIPGGGYSSAAVRVTVGKTAIMEHWEENKLGYRSRSWYSADWDGRITASRDLPQCYAAFQWIVGNEQVKPEVQQIGTLKAGVAKELSFSKSIAEYQRKGTYSLHVWSGGWELKQE